MFFGVVSTLVIKPLMRAQDERYARMDGAREAADKMDVQAAEAVRDYEAKHAKATDAAVEARDGLSDAADEERNALLAAKRAEVGEHVAAGNAKLARQAEAARAGMQAEVELLADLIVARLLEGGDA